MKKVLLAGLAISLVVISSGSAFASVIWDYSPATYSAATVSTDWSNYSTAQNFAEKVSFATGATVTGIDIYSGSNWGVVGESVTVRLWSDVSGAPGLLLQDIVTTISKVDTDGATGSFTRKHADFSSLLLTPGTNYWIGMSGSGELAQAGLLTIDDDSMAYFSGTTFLAVLPGLGDMAFRLEGTTGNSPVPEPATMLLFGTGIAGLAAVSRRKKVN
jgi:hypothetical protein